MAENMMKHRYEVAVMALADRAFYPPVVVEMEGDTPLFVCAAGHRFGTIRPEDGCHQCRELHEHRANGRPECKVDGCHTLVMCSDRAFEAGVRTCRRHFDEERSNEWSAGPICLDEYITVMGQYNNLRWNGWLMPRIDPWAVMQVAEVFADEELSYRYKWLDDGSLEVTDASQGDDELYVEVLHPDEDGLYALGAGSWTWSEDHDYGATEEWEAWAKEGQRVRITASNHTNKRLLAEGVTDARERYTMNQAAADKAYTDWLAENPEPAKYAEDA